MHLHPLHLSALFSPQIKSLLQCLSHFTVKCRYSRTLFKFSTNLRTDISNCSATAQDTRMRVHIVHLKVQSLDILLIFVLFFLYITMSYLSSSSKQYHFIFKYLLFGISYTFILLCLLSLLYPLSFPPSFLNSIL